jgi:hypothetical protein
MNQAAWTMVTELRGKLVRIGVAEPAHPVLEHRD